MSATTAHIGGAVAPLGLALLYVANRRDLRVAGLAAWGAGCPVLAFYLAPHGHHRLFAPAAVVGAIAAVAGAWLFLRIPWMLAVGVLACLPARITVDVGSTQANLLLPMYAVVAVAAIVLAWELYGEQPRSRELGPLAWQLAAFVAWEGLSVLSRHGCRIRDGSCLQPARLRRDRCRRVEGFHDAVGRRDPPLPCRTFLRRRICIAYARARCGVGGSGPEDRRGPSKMTVP